VAVTLWNDYICPWAYAARPHTAWLRSQGIEVDVRSYELHPDLPHEGRAVRPGGRLDQVFDHIAQECAASGLAFNKPVRSPNTHRLLGITELVRWHEPDRFDEVDAALVAAHWVEGRDIGDLDVVADLMSATGFDMADILEREADGEGSRLLELAMEAAIDVEVTATPAWRVGGLTITGLHSLDQFQRWSGRILGLQ
jgi:predicted DsbA family dithiol-disulfide isomerase